VLNVVIDSREQQGWSFPGDRFAPVRRKLRTGDYSLLGFEDVIAIERKSLGDLVQTVIHDAIRFRKELVRMSGFDVACIVVEADAADVWERRYDTEAEPAAVFGRLHGYFLDHGVPTFFWGRRQLCEPNVWRFLELAAKKLGA
jgi:ERCC4-type nuclease